MKKMLSLGLLFATFACGGGGDSPVAPSTPPPITKAIVTLNLDPKVQRAEYQGDGWWKFKVNEEFIETGGAVGFTLNSIRSTLTAPSGTILSDRNEAIGAHVAAGGRTVYQYTSARYFTNYNTGICSVVILASITDDKGNALTVSNNMSVTHAGQAVELP